MRSSRARSAVEGLVTLNTKLILDRIPSSKDGGILLHPADKLDRIVSMRLYHGTNSLFVEKCLKTGIAPRGFKKTNWKDYPSRSDLVYLTDAYPFYFAICATKKKNQNPVVLEIDADQAKTEEERFESSPEAPFFLRNET